jgi:hypothetical protein
MELKEKSNTGMSEGRLIDGLKRASWLFAIIVGLITMVIVGRDEYWDPISFLPSTIIAAVIGFIVFRIGIWVAKGFITGSKEVSGKE